MPENGWYGGNPFHGGPKIATFGELLAFGGKPGEQFAAYFPQNNSTGMDGYGLAEPPAIADAASRLGTAIRHGGFFEQDTGAVATDNAAVRVVANRFWRPDSNAVMVLKVSIPVITVVRFFAGFHATTSDAALGDDIHGSVDHAGISFSTARADTTFQLSTFAASQVLGDTLATVTTGVFTFVLSFPTDITCRLQVFDGNGVLVGDVTNETEIPTATVPLGWLVGVETLEGTLKQIQHFSGTFTQGTPR